jgi:hypothetical protein
VPPFAGTRSGRPLSTQEAFGRILVDLSRNPEIAPYLVTAAPDVATSTNLAGFINRTGVFAPAERRAWSHDSVLKWAEGPQGQHIELGISEMNLFLLLGQLGLAWDLSGQPLLPIGTVYDPFVCRGLETPCCAARSSPVPTGSSTPPRSIPDWPPTARPWCTWPPQARSCRRRSPPPRSWPTRGSAPTSSTSLLPTGCTRPGSAPSVRLHDLLPGSIVNAALAALSLR